MIDAREFGRIKAGYGPSPKARPKNADLLIDGIVFLSNKPFALLQGMKKGFEDQYGKHRIKISYTKSK